jgi:hypothetical protein
MSRVGVSITKSCAFRGGTQEFSNVYYYENAGGLPDEAQATGIIDTLTGQEKTWHSTNVTFVRGRLWSQGGSPGTNNMIAQKNLSGTGATSVVASMDRERAYLFRLRAGVDSRGNPVYLRKWYHSCGTFDSSVAPSATTLENTTGFTQAGRDTAAAKMDVVRTMVANAGPWELISKSGRPFTTGETFKCHQYLEHHQLGDQWRAQ